MDINQIASWLDMFALTWFLLCWVGYHIYSRRRNLKEHQGLLAKMNDMRQHWANSLLARENRMLDGQILNSLLHKSTFFASTTMLILASSIALFGLKDKASSLVEAIPFTQNTSLLLWEVKIGVLIIIFVYAFFKFTWSIRLHSYSAMVLSAIPPMTLEDSESKSLAKDLSGRLARLNNLASRHFNDGLRAYYFALAELSWLLHPILFIGATAWVVLVLYRREFYSMALSIISK